MDCPLSKEKQQLFSRLFEKSEDELLVVIGDSINKGFQGSVAECKNAALEYIVQKEKALRNAICIDWDYCNKKTVPQYANTLKLASAIADLIAVIVGQEPAAQIAVYLIKSGLDKYCNCK